MEASPLESKARRLKIQSSQRYVRELELSEQEQ
jgi:hypothetical protein